MVRAKFTAKLREILLNDKFGSVISWTNDGNSFQILNELEMSKVLQEYYISDKLKSFYRQLRLYGFKMKKNKSGIREFSHPKFHFAYRYNLFPMRKTLLKDEPTQQLDQLRTTLKDFQLQQLQILEKLNVQIRIHKQICKFIEYIKKQYFDYVKVLINEVAHNFMKNTFTLYLQHNESFYCNQTLKQILGDFEDCPQIYTPRVL